MSDDKDIIIFVSSTTRSLATSRVHLSQSSKQESVNALSGRDRKNMRQRRNIHPSSGDASSGSGGTDDEPEAARAIGRFLPRQTSVLTVISLALVGMYIGGWASAPVRIADCGLEI